MIRGYKLIREKITSNRIMNILTLLVVVPLFVAIFTGNMRTKWMDLDWYLEQGEVQSYTEQLPEMNGVEVDESGMWITSSNDAYILLPLSQPRYIERLVINVGNTDKPISTRLYYMTVHERIWNEVKAQNVVLQSGENIIDIDCLDKMCVFRLDYEMGEGVAIPEVISVSYIPADMSSRMLAGGLLLLLVCAVLFLLVRKPKWVQIALGVRDIAIFAIVIYGGFWLIQFNVYGYYAVNIMEKAYILKNLLFAFIGCLFLAVVFNSKKLACKTYIIVCGIFGVIDGYVMGIRGIPIHPQDFGAIDAALNVSKSYKFSITSNIKWTILFVVVFLVLNAFSTEIRIRDKKKRWQCSVLVLTTLVMMMVSFVSSNDILEKMGLKTDIWMINNEYSKQGIIASLVTDWKNMFVVEPEGYDIKQVEKVLEQYLEDEVDNKNTPDIIVVMNESFADLSEIGQLETNQPYLTYWNSLDENVVRGEAYVSAWGGGTVNSEYEFLTGNSRAFMPQAGYEYVKKETESLVSNLEKQGYETFAFHPYAGSGYKRRTKWEQLGFDNTVFLEDIDEEDVEKVRYYITDECNYKILEDAYERMQSPVFMFNITMQNHGGYGAELDEIQTVALDGNNGVNEYLSLVKMSDDAYKSLIEYYQQVDRDVVVLMFGDHQPIFGDDFYNYLGQGKVYASELEELQVKYKAPFMIWTNYDIEEKTDVTLSLNYLSSYLNQVTGVENTAYNNYLLELHKKIPAINLNVYMGDDGVWYAFDDKDSPYIELIKEYKNIEYYVAFDKRHEKKYF